MKVETIMDLLEQVAEKVEKDVAQVYIMFARQFDDEKLARDIAEKYGIDLEDEE